MKVFSAYFILILSALKINISKLFNYNWFDTYDNKCSPIEFICNLNQQFNKTSFYKINNSSTVLNWLSQLKPGKLNQIYSLESFSQINF
jgi:hypothetical protein